MAVNTEKKRAGLEPTEHKAFKRKANSFLTQEKAAEYFGIRRGTLINMLTRSTGQKRTIDAIRAKL